MVAMDMMIEQIRRRAYELWEANGMQGCDVAHWTAAEREIRGRLVETQAAKPAKVKRASAAAPARKAAPSRKLTAKASAAATTIAAH
jgi:hypothetical protein